MNHVLDHIVALPILIPLAAAITCLVVRPASCNAARAISTASVLMLVAVSAIALATAEADQILVYRLGNWPAPYGIVLVLDRLSALMLALTAVIAFCALRYASSGDDTIGRHFHLFFQLELVGLNGAFLTGDLFNLFVFFEILLLASYALLAHGGGKQRTRAALAYTLLNLAGSSVFLVALGLIYGMLGTLSLADLAGVLSTVPSSDEALVRTAFALLFSVFLLKSALVPMSFWLTRAYPAAAGSVAVLFVLMTKLGIYAVLRVAAISGPSPVMHELIGPWLTPLAIATIALGTVGALAANRLSVIVANLVLISSGTLLVAVAVGEPVGSAAALYYMVHSTLVTAGLFLVADLIARMRGSDRVGKGMPLPNASPIGIAYVLLAIAVSGLPPLSGFLGKLMIMQSVYETRLDYAIWSALLLSGLVVALVLSRTGSALFWGPSLEHVEASGRPHRPLIAASGAGLLTLLAASPLLSFAAAPVADYAQSTALQIHAREFYVDAVLGTHPVVREQRP